MKSKAFFIIFKGLSMKQITGICLDGESSTLIELYNFDCVNTLKRSKAAKILF